MNLEGLQAYVTDYNEQTGMTTYEIPNGACGNNTGWTMRAVVPANVTPSTQVVAYIDGEGGNSWGNATSALMRDGSDSIVISAVNGENYEQATIQQTAQTNLNIIDTSINIFGGDRNNVGIYGASNGSVYAFTTVAESLKGDSNINFAWCTNVDYFNSGAYMSDSDIQLLTDNGVRMIIVTDNDTPSPGGCRYPGYQMTANGRNGKAIILEYPAGFVHDQKCYFPIEDGLLDWLAGTGELDIDKRNAMLYQFINGQQGTDAKTPDEILDILGINSGIYGDNYQIKLSRDDINRLDLNEQGTVASDVVTVIENLNKIVAEMNKSDAAIAPMRQTTTSTAPIPAQLSQSQDVFLNISHDLLCRLDREMTLIQSVAQTFYDMDKGLADAAGNLATGGNLFTNSAESIDATLSRMISEEISARTTFNGTFLYDMTSLTEGKVGSISMVDIDKMLGESGLTGALHDNFESERNSATQTKIAIDGFIDIISSSTNLQGDAWKLVGQKLSTYSELMQTRIESADKLEAAMTEALTKIKNYMGDYEVLDDSRLPELRSTLEQIKKDLAHAKKVVSATKVVQEWVVDNAGNQYYKEYTVYVYDAASRQEAQEYIEWATVEIPIIEAEKAKLEGLPEIMRQAQDVINQAMVEIYGDYGVKTSEIVSGKESTYIPPSYTRHTPVDIPEYTGPEQTADKRESIFRGRFWYGEGKEQIYGSYEDYLNGVKAEDNPTYNKDLEDSGISSEYEYDMTYDILENSNSTTQDETNSNIYRETNGRNLFGPLADQQSSTPEVSAPSENGESEVSAPTENEEAVDLSGGNVGATAPGSQGGGGYNSGGQTYTPPASDDNTIGTEQPSTEVEPPLDNESSETEKPPVEDTTNDQTPDNSEKPIDDKKPAENQKPIDDKVQEDTQKPIETIKPSKPTIPNPTRPSDYNIPNAYTPNNNSSTIGTPNVNDTVINDVPVLDDTLLDSIIDEPIIEEPSIELPVEDDTSIIEPSLPELDDTPIELPSEPTKKDSGNETAKAIATLVGVGAAVGGAAYGAHRYIKSREDSEEKSYDEEYDY